MFPNQVIAEPSQPSDPLQMMRNSDCSRNKSQNTFVSQTKGKTMPNSNLGFEYDRDIKNDTDFYKRIFESNCYGQNSKFPVCIVVDSSKQSSAAGNYKDKENQFDGFREAHPHSSTMTSSFSVQELEATLGKYACKKLGKKVKSKEGFLQEDFIIVKIKWLVKMAKFQHQMSKYNLNNFRIIIEKIIKEASPTFEIHLFQHPKKITNQLKKLSKFLSKLEPQKAILLSYKLFKIYLKQVDLQNKQTQFEIAKKLHDLFLPYLRLMEIKEVHPNEKTRKMRANLVTYKKIKKLTQKPFFIDLLYQYQDPKKTPDHVATFQAFLREKVSLEKALRELASEGKHILENPMPLNQAEVQEEVEVEIQDLIDTIGTYEQTRPSVHEACESFMDAMSFEIMEKQIQHDFCLAEYNFQKKCSFYDKAKIPILSEGSSNEESERELMENSALYEKKNSSNSLDKNKEGEVVQNDVVLEKLSNGASQSPDRNRLHEDEDVKDGANAKFSSCADVESRADPMRVSQRVEIVRMNSFDNIANAEERQRKMEEEIGSPSKLSPTKLLKENSVPVRYHNQASSLCKRSMSTTKIKKEMSFQKVLGLAYDDIAAWEKVIKNQIIKIEKIKPENSPVLLLRAWAIIEGFTPREVFEQIYNTEKRCKWDTVTADICTVEKIDQSSDIIHFVIKTPFGITERDFLQRRDYIFDYPEEGTITMSFQSCEHPLKPPTKNRVRGETHIAGYIIKPSTTKPNSTDLCVLTQCDIKGKVPKAIVNLCASRAPADWVAKLKKACENERLRAGR